MTVIRHKVTDTGFSLVTTTYDTVNGFMATYQRYTTIGERTFFEESQPFSSESAAIAYYNQESK